MQAPSLSLAYQVRAANSIRPNAKPPLVLLLHGIGADEFDLFDLGLELDPRFVVVSARAPYEWGPGFGWFNLELDGPNMRPNIEQAADSRDALIAFMSECERAFATDPEQVFLMGFSQGAMMASSVTLSRPELVAGVVMMSGALLPLTQPSAGVSSVPFMLTHGVHDPVLPVNASRAARDELRRLGASVEYREYAMAHQISQASFTDVLVWLADRLDASD